MTLNVNLFPRCSLEKIGGIRFWQLATNGYYVHHMENHIPNFISKLPWLEPSVFQEISRSEEYGDKKGELPAKTLFYRICHLTVVRTLLKKIHLATYRLLFE